MRTKWPLAFITILPLFLFGFHIDLFAKGVWDSAREKKEAKDYQGAISFYEKAAEIDPDNSEILLEWAQTAAWAQDYEKALELYDKVLAKEPNNGDARLGKAYVYSWQKKYAEAEKQFRGVISDYPDYIDAYSGLARMLSWQKKFDEAEILAETALNLDPENEASLQLTAQIYFWGGRPDKAIPLYENLVEKHPTQSAPLVSLSRAYWENGEEKKAIASLKKAQELEPANANLGAELGQYYARTNQLDDAITELEKTIALKSANVDDFISLGRVYSFKNRLNDSKELYAKALAKEPKNVDALNGLARVYGYGREWEMSQKTFEDALKIDPGNAEALEGLERLHQLTSPEVTLWHQFLRFRAKDPMGRYDIETLSQGPVGQFRYKFNPEASLLVRGARFQETDRNIMFGGTDLNVIRTEAGIGGEWPLNGRTKIIGRMDTIHYADEKDAFYGRQGGVSQGAGYFVLNHELNKHLLSAVLSKDVYLRTNTIDASYDMVYTRGYSLSDDISWSNQFSTLFQAGLDNYSYLPDNRNNLLTRGRYRPQAIPSLLLETEARYRNQPNEWSFDGIITWKGFIRRKILAYQLSGLVHHNTLMSITGPKFQTLLIWKISRRLNLTTDVSYAKDVDFYGTQFESRSYLNYGF